MVLQLLWKTVRRFLKNLNLKLSYDPTSGYKPNENENRDMKKHLHTHVHGNIIHNSQKVETTQMSTKN